MSGLELKANPEIEKIFRMKTDSPEINQQFIEAMWIVLRKEKYSTCQ